MAFGKGFDKCNNTCWACEYKDDGSSWENATVAQQACNQSALGYCKWTTDSGAANRYGWCDFPTEFEYGAGDCNSNCQDCSMSNNPQTACLASYAGCKWDSLTSTCISTGGRTCASSCTECWSQNDCTNTGGGGSGNCTWDAANSICKIKGFTGEICFNGADDDNDMLVDCADSDCSFDQFCGGKAMASCPQYTNSSACGNATVSSMGMNCTWFTPPFGGPPYCANPGEQCWAYKSNQSVCSGAVLNSQGQNLTTSGCEWASVGAGRCSMNETRMQPCFTSNQSVCNGSQLYGGSLNLSTFCLWSSEFSRCDPLPAARCGMNQSRQQSQSACEAGGQCVWVTESFTSGGGGSMMGGHCEPPCNNRSISSDIACGGAWPGFCEWISGECRPKYFGGAFGGGGAGGGFASGGFKSGCSMSDGNYTRCMLNNVSCAWTNATGAQGGGYCSDKMVQQMFGGMMRTDSGGNMQMGSPPTILAQKSQNLSISQWVNIREFGIKDEFKAFMFGISVYNISPAAVCNGYPISGGGGNGNGSATAKFYWYLDTNGNTTDNCNATGVSANHTGFEFLIKYETAYSNTTNYTETKVFYKCSNSSWVPTTTVITPWKEMGCPMAGGAVMGVEKESLKKFSTYNATKNMRIIVTTANSSGSYSSPQDMLGPNYYMPGTIDFKFECCECPGADMDGDGITSDKDPDCKFFKKMGYHPMEDCMNGKDDNNDGLIDCSDPACMQTPKCGGSFSFSSNSSDKTAPTITYSKVESTPDGVFIKADTNEPANMTVQFYHNDSTCMNTTFSYYKEAHDLGGPMAFDDYKPFHFAAIDNYQYNPYKLGYNLTNGTIYYYKIKICDMSSNCGYSACMNFTTESLYSTMLFKFVPPTGFAVTSPALNHTNDNMSNSITVNST
ncbi:MAG: hypothetical protein HZC29_06375, partial [Thaumarchaeota archaeon]|nr:hypothetical protein [Nitrososphaerota archaeon]